MLIKIICIAAVTIITSAIIKQYRSDISLVITICGGIAIIMLCMGELNSIIEGLIGISANSQISEVMKPIIKVLGIGYLTEFSADIAEDAGNKTIQSKILFGGKIAICSVAFPIITKILSSILSLLSL